MVHLELVVMLQRKTLSDSSVGSSYFSCMIGTQVASTLHLQGVIVLVNILPLLEIGMVKAEVV